MTTPAGPPLVVNNPHPPIFQIKWPCDTTSQGSDGSIDYFVKNLTCWYVGGLPILPIRVDPVFNNIMEAAMITNLNMGIWLTPVQATSSTLPSSGWGLV